MQYKSNGLELVKLLSSLDGVVHAQSCESSESVRPLENLSFQFIVRNTGKSFSLGFVGDALDTR